MRWALWTLLIASLLTFASTGFAQGVSAPTALSVVAPPENDGLNLELSWELSADDPGPVKGYAVLRAAGESADGDSDEWVVLSASLPPGTKKYSDTVTTDVWTDAPSDAYRYRVVALAAPIAAEKPAKPDEKPVEKPAKPDKQAKPSAIVAKVLAAGTATDPVVGRPEGAWVRTGIAGGTFGPLLMLLIIVAMGVMMWRFAVDVRKGKDVYIRRIPGIDAIEEGIGRATEMGKPILYVPGIDELQDIQTIAAMLILGQVSQKVASYQSDIIVSCCIPIVREVADEVVRAGYYQAGHPDDYKPSNTRFIAAEQFAFCAGTNGIMYREKPATNIYFGRFFAESLILAETGFVNKSIQIAGTAEATQLPFFIAACDYTLIGEELFAVSAYLSKDPRLVSSLKASDWVKLFCVGCILLGTAFAAFGSGFFIKLFTLSGGQ